MSHIIRKYFLPHRGCLFVHGFLCCANELVSLIRSSLFIFAFIYVRECFAYESEYTITQYLVKVIVGSDMTNVKRGDEQLYLKLLMNLRLIIVSEDHNRSSCLCYVCHICSSTIFIHSLSFGRCLFLLHKDMPWKWDSKEYIFCLCLPDSAQNIKKIHCVGVVKFLIVVVFGWVFKNFHHLSTVILNVFSHYAKSYQNFCLLQQSFATIVGTKVLQHVGTSTFAKGLEMNDFS